MLLLGRWWVSLLWWAPALMSSVFKLPVLQKSTKGEEGGALDVFPITPHSHTVVIWPGEAFPSSV